MKPIIYLIAPCLNGPISGGTHYNRKLLAALNHLGHSCQHLSLQEAQQALSLGQQGIYLCDSLYLHAFPRLQKQNRGTQALWLLLHYLPSHVKLGKTNSYNDLSTVETEAFACCDGIVTTGRYMADEVASFHQIQAPLICVEPGTDDSSIKKASHASTYAVMLCALNEEKGVLPFLQALAQTTHKGDDFRLQIAGPLGRSPKYNELCQSTLKQSTILKKKVEFLGPLPHKEAQTLLGSAQVYISASRMESYGMALAEARAAGLIVLALNRGNTPQHVQTLAGGTLCETMSELAQAFVELTRSPKQLKLRKHKAEQCRPSRPWSTVAAELIAQLNPN